MNRYADTLARVMIAAGFCLVIFGMFTGHMQRTGRFPGHVQVFHPSGGDAHDDIPRGQFWHDRPAYPYPSAIRVVGPLDTDGKIIPMHYYSSGGEIEDYRDENGVLRWRAKQPRKPVGWVPYGDRRFYDVKSLLDERCHP